MHRHGRFHHGPRGFRPWRPFGGFIWLFLLMFLFMGGRGWPGLLILLIVAGIVGSLFRSGLNQWPQNQPPMEMPMRPPVAPAPPAPTVIPAPEPIHRADLLPTNCPNCGGPIRAHEVKWIGQQAAACPYCGSNLPMKKT